MGIRVGVAAAVGALLAVPVNASESLIPTLQLALAT
jgi:hypothetical protein